MREPIHAPALALRVATADDVAAISGVILPFCPLAAGTPQGDAFIATLTPEAMRTRLRDGAWHFVVALVGGAIVGVASIRDAAQLTHLFVDAGYHGRGLARSLWQAILAHARAQGHDGAITFNADLDAVDVYRRFGFKVAGEQCAPNGVPFIRMVFDA